MDRGTVSWKTTATAEIDGAVTAVFHHLVPNAKVVGIEHIKELADWSKENLRNDGIEVGEAGVKIIHGDGRLGELTGIAES